VKAPYLFCDHLQIHKQKTILLFEISSMKNLLVSMLMLLSTPVVFCQRIDSTSIAKLTPEQRQEVTTLLTEAKNARNAGLGFTIGGGAAMLIGGIIFGVTMANDDWFDGKEPDYTPGTTLFVIGAVAEIVSIPFYVTAHSRGAKARAIIFADKGVGITPYIKMPNTASVGVQLVIPFGK
jgi:hypothetical protein